MIGRLLLFGATILSTYRKTKTNLGFFRNNYFLNKLGLDVI